MNYADAYRLSIAEQVKLVEIPQDHLGESLKRENGAETAVLSFPAKPIPHPLASERQAA